MPCQAKCARLQRKASANKEAVLEEINRILRHHGIGYSDSSSKFQNMVSKQANSWKNKAVCKRVQ
jgi:ubiquinone/menaquinone biosynthesis C-methylase UbiE